MMSLQDKLRGVLSALLTVSDAEGTNIPVYHYRRSEGLTAGYIVWSEDSETDSFDSDNRKAEQQIHGTIDYYTQTEFDAVVDNVQSALDAGRIGYRLNSVQYEDETALIHWEWEFFV